MLPGQLTFPGIPEPAQPMSVREMVTILASLPPRKVSTREEIDERRAAKRKQREAKP